MTRAEACSRTIESGKAVLTLDNRQTVNATITIYIANETASPKFQKKHVRANLVPVFEVCPKDSATKKAMLSLLEEAAKEFLEKLTEYSAMSPGLAAVEPLPPLLPLPPIAAANRDVKTPKLLE